jgi:hypothetical protein
MQRPGAEMGSFAVNARPETTRIREFGRHVFEIAGLSRASLNMNNLRVWGDGRDRTATPHAVTSNRSLTSELGTEIFDAAKAGVRTCGPLPNQT